MHVVKAENLSKHYENGTIKSVDNISFSIEKGKVAALLGANGAGKSTTIKMLTGLIKPTAGHLYVANLTYDKDADNIRHLFGYVPEESSMYEDIGLIDYLRFFSKVYNVPHHQSEKRMQKILKRLDLDVGNRIVGNLSKGMKRKVLITRSLLHDPPLLIFDEPASGLDPKTAHSILVFMDELRKEGKTILFSSHNLSHVEQIADQVLIMHKGKLITNTTMAELVKASTQYTIHFFDGTTTKTNNFKEAQAIIANKEKAVVDITNDHRSLEEVFLQITQ